MAVGILTLIIGALLVIFLSSQSSYLSMDASLQVQEQTRRAFDAMVRELREAGNVVACAVPPCQTLDFELALGYNLINPSTCPANAVCWGAFDGSNNPQKDWHVVYSIEPPGSQGAQLIRRVKNGATTITTRILANLVDGATASSNFTYDATGRIITIKLQTTTPTSSLVVGGPRSSGVLTTQVKLRNP